MTRGVLVFRQRGNGRYRIVVDSYLETRLGHVGSVIGPLRGKSWQLVRYNQDGVLPRLRRSSIARPFLELAFHRTTNRSPNCYESLQYHWCLAWWPLISLLIFSRYRVIFLVMSQRDEPAFVEVDGKSVRLTHLSKILFPDDGITKAELLLYYQTVASVLLPHIRGRPLTMKAFPHGISGRPYYRRRLASTTPAWVSRVELEDGFAPVIEDTADLIWVVNQDSVELHPWLSRRDNLDFPDLLVFDLDPGANLPFPRLCEAAMFVKEALDSLEVESWPKTSGGSGLHILVNLVPMFEFEEVHTWVIAVARILTQRRPDLFSMDYTRSRRTEKVLLDHNQVGYGRTTASIYSVRPLPGAPVSAPLTWDEVASGNITPGQFTIKTMPDRLSSIGDVAGGLTQSMNLLPHL